MEKQTRNRLYPIIKNVFLISICCTLFSQAIPKTTPHTGSLRYRYNALKSTIKSRTNRFYKSLRGSKKCSRKEILRARLILCTCICASLHYFSYLGWSKRRTVYPQHDGADIPFSTDEPIGQTPQRTQERRAQERQQQEHAERVRRTYEQLQREEEEFRREHLAREQLQQEQAGRIRLEQLRRVQRERIAREKREIQPTQQNRREQMERERQARLAHYQEGADQTATCLICSQTDSTLRPIPCSNKHDGERCCRSCIKRIQNIGTLAPGDIIQISKPCPLCRQPLHIASWLFNPMIFPCVLDENSERILRQRQQIATFLQQQEGSRIARPSIPLSRYAYHPNY